MEDALSSALKSLTAKGAALGASPTPEQLAELRSACAAALAVSRSQGQPGAVHQKRLWEAAASLWNTSIELDPIPSSKEADGDAGSGEQRGAAVATLLQAACDLSSLLPQGSLPRQQDVLHLVRFHHRCGQALAAFGELEAAEAVLSRGAEAAAAHGLSALCFEQRGRGPLHQDCAELLFLLLLDRLRASLHLRQQVLSSGLIQQAQAFVSDPRLPQSEGQAFRLHLIRVLYEQGEALAKGGDYAAAAPLLNTAYECLSQLALEPESEDAELAAMAAEVQAMGASVLALLTLCSVEAGEAVQAQACLQALRSLADPAADAHFATTFLSLRTLLLVGRAGDAEEELLTLVSHEDATPEGCLAGLQAALAAPGGARMARCALSTVLERFADEPAVAVELARAALAAASAAAAAQAAPDSGCGGDGAEGRTASSAEALVLELAGDERLLERVCEEPGLQDELLGLLWNHAVAALHSGQAFDSALAFFSAALPLLESGAVTGGTSQAPGGSESHAGAPTVAACRRAQALCCLGARQFERALEFLEKAAQLEPGSVPTAMLRLSVQLAAGSEAGATAAVAALADCCAAQPDALRIACVQAIDAGATAAARQALLCLLEKCKAAGSPGAANGDSDTGSAAASSLRAPGFEATVFQNLIHLLLSADHSSAAGSSQAADAAAGSSSPSQHCQLAILFDQAVERMRAVGPEAFFATQEGQPLQQEWFTAQAWNAGQAAGTAGELQHSAVLLAVCGEVCAALPAPSLPMLHRQKMAFLMAAACACDVHTQQAADERYAAAAGEAEAGAPRAAVSGQGSAASLALAQSYIQQARAAASALAEQEGQLGGSGGDPKSDVFLLLLEFKLAGMAGNTKGQLEALSRARALPAFGAQHFAMAAAWARAGQPGGGQPCTEVIKAALEGRLQCLTAQTPMECAAVAETLRSLIELTPDDAGRLHWLGESAGLLSAEPPGSFPPLEVGWLVTTAWNRGAVHARLGRAAEAERFQAWALEALPHADARLTQQHREKIEAELHKTRSMLAGSAATARER